MTATLVAKLGYIGAMQTVYLFLHDRIHRRGFGQFDGVS